MIALALVLVLVVQVLTLAAIIACVIVNAVQNEEI